MMPSWWVQEGRACVQPLDWPKLDLTPLVYPNFFLLEVTLSPLKVGSMLRLESGYIQQAPCKRLANVNLVCTKMTGSGICTIR